MNRWRILSPSLPLLAGAAPNCSASGVTYHGIEDDRTTGVKHGLFEIRPLRTITESSFVEGASD
jgi:hypothetical protein